MNIIASPRLTPPYITYHLDLPLSRLHVLESGKGEPLIIVPATISELRDWRNLAQFMAQWFKVYFFELPGHGESSAFPGKFSSHRVADLVCQMVDKLGHSRFNLMGFSFGGILAMRTFKLLSDRIDRLVMIAPCLGQTALPISRLRWSLLFHGNRLLSHPRVQQRFVDLIHSPRTISMMVKALQKIGKLEVTIPLQDKLPRASAGTISVLNAQIEEILTTEFKNGSKKHDTPCYFAMSIRDPLLRFDVTEQILQSHFSSVNTVRLDYPFHQPPAPFTFDELNRDFGETVEAFLRPRSQPVV